MSLHAAIPSDSILPASCCPLATMPGIKAQALLTLAKGLAEQSLNDAMPMPLKGRIVGLVSDSADHENEAMFCEAVEALGGRVALIRPDLDASSGAAEVKETARMLGRLYAAIEAPHMCPALLEQVHKDAAIPVYDGISSPAHPIAQLAHELDCHASPDAKRRLLLQAALLLTIA